MNMIRFRIFSCEGGGGHIFATKYQIENYKKRFLKFVNPDFIKCIVDQHGKLICFSITMPSFTEALKKINGKLNIFYFRLDVSFLFMIAQTHSQFLISMLFEHRSTWPDSCGHGTPAVTVIGDVTAAR